MTVRLTPTESDSTPPHHIPAPPDPSDVQVTTPGAADLLASTPVSSDADSERPTDVPRAPGPRTVAEGRRALREARRKRRRTAWLCAAVVAVCLGLTIVVVTLARYRPVAPPSSVAITSMSPSTVTMSAAALVDRAVRTTYRGAPASEGGNP